MKILISFQWSSKFLWLTKNSKRALWKRALRKRALRLFLLSEIQFAGVSLKTWYISFNTENNFGTIWKKCLNSGGKSAIFPNLLQVNFLAISSTCECIVENKYQKRVLLYFMRLISLTKSICFSNWSERWCNWIDLRSIPLVLLDIFSIFSFSTSSRSSIESSLFSIGSGVYFRGLDTITVLGGSRIVWQDLLYLLFENDKNVSFFQTCSRYFQKVSRYRYTKILSKPD